MKYACVILSCSLVAMDMPPNSAADTLDIHIEHMDSRHSHPVSITVKDLEAATGSSSSTSHALRKRDRYAMACIAASAAIGSAAVTAIIAAAVSSTQCK